MNNKKSFFIIFMIVATEMIGFGLIIPVLPQFSQRMGITGTWLGVLLSAYSLCQFFAAPILGALSDKYGRRLILNISQLGTVISYILLAMAGNFWLLLLARMVDGITGGNISVTRAYISDITTPEERPKGMAVLGMAFGLGFILGPALGGIIFSFTNTLAVAALIAGGFSMAALLLTFFFLPEPQNHSGITKQIKLANFFKVFKDRKILTMLLAEVIFFTSMFGFHMTFSLLTHNKFGLDEKSNSYLFMMIGFVNVLTQAVIIKKAKGNLSHMALLSMSVTAIGVMLVGILPSLIWLYAIFVIFAVASSVTNAYLPSLISTARPNDPEGEVMGVFESLGSLSRVIGPIIAASMLPLGFGWAYALLGMVALIGVAVLAKGRKMA